MAKEIAGGSTGAGGRRRYWKRDEKRRIVAESHEAGASVAKVAGRYGLNANLLFTWRRQFAVSEAAEPAAILPVTIAPSTPLAFPTASEAAGRMEITLSSGEKIVVGADVEAAALARVIKALRR
jgi:transposase